MSLISRVQLLAYRVRFFWD